MVLPLEKRAALMCLTQDGLPWSHEEQAERLCAAGARWIQLRMKNAVGDVWLATAKRVVEICRKRGSVCVINDSVEVALAAGADGVHLGTLDLNWAEARSKLGANRIVGGTVNNTADARLALSSGCLDYVGVGPWRFTRNKHNLSPVLGPEGIRPLIQRLGNLPAWVIGGVEAADLPQIAALGAAGAAVSSALYRGGAIEQNFTTLRQSWPFAQSAREIRHGESTTAVTTPIS